jgi:hypothetical protein
MGEFIIKGSMEARTEGSSFESIYNCKVDSMFGRMAKVNTMVLAMFCPFWNPPSARIGSRTKHGEPKK